ncbi:MAG: protein phosphatase 2C domain-containing protein [Clostridia bacterium]|nr:protein phosphatase 2C domain-containing protein [Clostridia bacterium]
MIPPVIASFSLPGGRVINEDTVLSTQTNKRTFALVADGLGGYGGGDAASHAAASAIMDSLTQSSRLSRDILAQAFNRANAAVLACQAEHQGKMMSTMAVIGIEHHRLWIAHLGDTRIYCFQGRQLRSCTHDDSVTQLLVDRGEISRDEMPHHETRNLLTKCLGRMEQPDEKIDHYFWGKHSRVLICSDGFWENFTDEELTHIVTGSPIETALEQLKELTLQRLCEDSDNCSALLIG